MTDQNTQQVGSGTPGETPAPIAQESTEVVTGTEALIDLLGHVYTHLKNAPDGGLNGAEVKHLVGVVEGSKLFQALKGAL